MFVDASLGQVFLYKGGLKLLNDGLDTFFKTYAVVKDNNPFQGNGITIGYDPQYNRILLTIKNNKVLENAYTIVPNFVETPEFFESLVPNQSIVYKDGRWQLFKGLNNTIYDCKINLPPVITGFNGTIAEDAAPGSQAASVSATDPENSALTYVIISGNTGNAFSITSEGKIVLNASGILDYETKTSYLLTVRAIDTKGLYAQTTVTIAITDVIEPVVLKDAEATISEVISNGAPVVTLQGSGAGSLVYSIVSGNDQGAFLINSTTGAITVLDESKIVYEANPVFNLITRVTNGDSTDDAVAKITILEVNEAPITSNMTGTFPESTPAGTTLFTYDAATDPEEGELAYSIFAQSTPGMFVIDLVNRTLKLAPGMALDYETKPQHTVTIRATDDHPTDPQHTDIVLTVNVKQICFITADIGAITEDGEFTASVQVIPTSGIAPYTYLWSNGQTTQTGQFLIKGNEYSVVVTDANGCTVAKTVTPNLVVLTGLKLEVQYFNFNTGDPSDPFAPRACTSGHMCNNAKYEVRTNGISQGVANMNNDGGSADDDNKPPNYPNYPDWTYTDRYWTKTLSGSDATAIADSNGQVLVQLVYVGGGTPHASAIQVKIRRSDGTLLVNTCMDSFTGYDFNPYV